MGRLPAVRRSRLPHHCVACGAELQPPHRRLRCSNCIDGPRLAAHTTSASAPSLNPYTKGKADGRSCGHASGPQWV